jgi:hypothetical protein
MDNSLLLDIVKMTVPVVTFALGSLFTLRLKRREFQRDARRASVREVVRIARDWYTQIQQLALQAAEATTETAFPGLQYMTEFEGDRKFEAKLKDYLTNRLLLPDMLLNVGLVREHPSCRKFVIAAEDFLSAVTNYRYRVDPREATKCEPIFSGAVRSEEVLRQLDSRLQALVSQAAAMLRVDDGV